MRSIHFICKEDEHLQRVGTDRWESGNWAVTAEDAASLVGGLISLHKTKAKPSYFGGWIEDVRPVVTEDARSVRYVFRFQFFPQCKGVDWDGADHPMAWTSGVLDDGQTQ